MQYRKGCGEDQLSALSYGCLRFTKKGAGIDFEKAETEIMEAIRGGVNYFDTAYIYRGSEVALGKILEKNQCRNQVYIATKLPQFLVRSAAAFDKYFDEQRKRLKTDYVDYYLLHMLSDIASWERLVEMGIQEWIEDKKSRGEIRHIGFSYHGDTEMFLALLEVYDWDFCQMQYNYLDENSQGGKAGLQAAHKKSMPVIVMEPLRGGRLVTLLPTAARAAMEADHNHWSPAEWAFRWLWNQKEVTSVLSGMNSLDMIKENIRVAQAAFVGGLTPGDFVVLDKVKQEINDKIQVGCTGCEYCLPCPQGVDIVNSFRCLNLKYTENRGNAIKEYFKTTAGKKHPGSASMCNECGRCESHCPQQIPIRRELKRVARELETPYYKLARMVFRWLSFK